MKSIALALLLLLPFLGGCAKMQSLDSITVTRIVAEPNGYRDEMGTYTAAGFVPSSVTHWEYPRGGFSPEDVKKIDGKPIMPLALWNQISAFRHKFQRADETVTIDHVPYVILKN